MLTDLLPWLLLPPAVLALSLVITGQTRRSALARSLIDHPSDRGSHSEATPRGGGMGLVVAILFGTAWLGLGGTIDTELTWALTLGGAAVATIGWIDDHGHVKARWRALIHALAAAWALYQLGGLPVLDLGAGQLQLGVFGIPLALIAIVWLTNLYNFMDGIDGIAGTQAVFTAAAAGVLLFINGAPGTALLCLIVVAANIGFLYWNWPRARIFMGDIGSGFLGFYFAVLAIYGGNSQQLPTLLWALLLAPFIADASYTLLARILRREAWYQPHRQHAYQRLIQRGLSHRRVTVSCLLINLVLILPALWLANTRPATTPIAIIVVYLLLWFLWRWTRQAPRSLSENGDRSEGKAG